MDLTNYQLLENLGIELKGKRSGQVKVLCPSCSSTRKNKRDPSLSVDIGEGLYNCHHCGFKGRVFNRPKKEYITPVARLEKLSEKSLKWFEQERGISNNTLLLQG
jgi:twinkle protein